MRGREEEPGMEREVEEEKRADSEVADALLGVRIGTEVESVM